MEREEYIQEVIKTFNLTKKEAEKMYEQQKYIAEKCRLKHNPSLKELTEMLKTEMALALSITKGIG